MTEVRRLRSARELADVDRLYRDVFAVDDTGLNVRLLTAIADNGGAVLGVRLDDELVAFGLSLLARDAGGLHHYSQTVAVAPAHQGRGLGRLVKQAQRDAAVADGLTRMRWVFDPLHARNAHFNLDVLGGRVRTLRRDYYGTAGHGLDPGEPTDRCTVDWPLCERPDQVSAPSEPVPPGEIRRRDDVTLVGLPAFWRERRRTLSPTAAAAQRESVIHALETELAAGQVAVSCVRTGEDTAAYVLRHEATA